MIAKIKGIERIHFKKFSRKTKVTLIVIGLLIVVETAALLWLLSTVSTYKNFWIQEAQRPGEITYLALGDSAAQGIGATKPERGYVGLIAERIEQQTGKKVRVVNLSRTGAKMEDYLREQAPHIDDIQADIVTIEIGANDIATYDPVLYRSNFKRVLDSLPSGTYVANMPLFNSRPMSTAHAKHASQIVEEELQSYSELYFVDLQKQTSENQSIFGFAPDLFHPNNLSYKNWADAFWLRIQKTKYVD